MAKKIALVFGVVFVLVGILGFVSNPLVGPAGLFETDMLHNIVHVLFGVVLLGAALRMPLQSALWLKIIGVVYLILAVLGFLTVPNGGPLLGLVMTNVADHWLHVVLGVVLVAAGFLAKDGPSGPSAPVM
ncbi:MAG: DUF4383 domain-containing protein [Patescibacteria group bacterium]|mgnify:CR=1 FL=1